MKKKICFLAIFLFIGMGVHAQGFELGAKAGINFASFSGSDANDLDFEGRTGWHLGLVMEVPFTTSFSIQPEVLYSTLGGRTNQLEFEQATDTDFKLDYISVPVMFKYYIWEGLNVEAGPQFSFNTKSDVEGNFEGQDISEDIQDETSSVDIGGAFGLAYNLPYGLFAQIRYVVGFSEVYNDISFDGNENTDLRNDLLQLSLGLKF